MWNKMNWRVFLWVSIFGYNLSTLVGMLFSGAAFGWAILPIAICALALFIAHLNSIEEE